MLKLKNDDWGQLMIYPAAFGRLCVETSPSRPAAAAQAPAAFGRLCVETKAPMTKVGITAPAAFGRLCVETLTRPCRMPRLRASRLRAAVC